jgi:hypothetical protein
MTVSGQVLMFARAVDRLRLKSTVGSEGRLVARRAVGERPRVSSDHHARTTRAKPPDWKQERVAGAGRRHGLGRGCTRHALVAAGRLGAARPCQPHIDGAEVTRPHHPLEAREPAVLVTSRAGRPLPLAP